MKTTEIKIEMNEILLDFNKHLGIDGNNRILFSGPFGTGKSTFLNDFTTEFQEEYFAVKIYPVHYSVASNEDVFELIKYDILFHLLSVPNKILDLQEEDFSKFLKSQFFIQNQMKLKPLLYSILGLSDKIGTPVVDFIKALDRIVTDFKGFDEETKIDEKQLIKDYLKSFEVKIGNIHENDSNSQLISELLERIKIKEEKPLKTVLIIDDLDRLDPEHIFRLFNIFSAHHYEVTNTNKFGFDKVIFVCDVENIRKIFHHRYGSEVDFSGYIDKFYTLTPYHFDNRKYVKEKIDLLVKQIEFDSKLEKYNFNQSFSTIFNDCLKSILFSLIELNIINLRMLINVPKLEIKELEIKLSKHASESNINLPIVVIFHILKNYFGNFEITRTKLAKLKNSFDHKNFKSDNHYLYDNELDIKKIISYCLPFLLPQESAFAMILESEKQVFLDKYGVTVYYRGFKEHNNGQVVYFQATKGGNESGIGDLVILNPFEILLDTFDVCNKIGYL